MKLGAEEEENYVKEREEGRKERGEERKTV